MPRTPTMPDRDVPSAGAAPAALTATTDRHTRSLAGRTTWSIADQAVSSATNFAVAMLLARSLGPDEFGGFAFGFAVWLFVNCLVRPLIVQPFVIDAATLDHAGWKSATAHVTGASFVVAGACSIAIVGVALLGPVGADVAGVLVVLAIMLPGLIVQDVWRYSAFAAGRPDAATKNDLIWAGAQAVLLAALWQLDELTATSAMGAWGLGAGIAAMVGIRQFGVAPRIDRSSWQWARAAVRLGGWFTLSNLLYALSTLAVTVMVAGRTGAAGNGGMRATQTLFAPLALLSAGTEGVALPEAARAAAAGPARLRKVVLAYGAVLVVATTLAGVVLAAVADSVMVLLFGPEFDVFAELVPPFAVTTVLSGVVGAGALGLRTGRHGASLVVAQAPAALVKAVACWILLERHGLLGAAWGMVIGNAVHAILVWMLLLNSLGGRQERRPGTAEPGVDTHQVGLPDGITGG